MPFYVFAGNLVQFVINIFGQFLEHGDTFLPVMMMIIRAHNNHLTFPLEKDALCEV